MKRTDEILSTVRMLEEEHLDVRTVTMGINLSDCSDRRFRTVLSRVRRKILSKAANLVKTCDDISAKYGIPVVNKRIAISPASQLLEGFSAKEALLLGKLLDECAVEVNIDLIGGFSALVHKGMTPGEVVLIKALPDVLSGTRRVCSSVNVASTRSGINVDAALLVAQKIIETSAKTASSHGFGSAKIVVFANIPEDNPFMAGAYLGYGQAECVINVGVSGPGVVKRAVERLVQNSPRCSLEQIADEIKHSAFRVTRTGELIGRETAKRLGVVFGALDLSLAPTPKIGDSVGEIYRAMGIERIGAPGTTAAVALVNDAVKKGGAFASSSVGGMSGAFIPVMEDRALSEAVNRGDLSIEKLEAMTAVCSVGIDMVLLPGSTTPEAVCGLILDECAIGVSNGKTTGVRVIPVPGGRLGQYVDFGGLFGSGRVTDFAAPSGQEVFVRRGGQIPAPIRSMTN